MDGPDLGRFHPFLQTHRVSGESLRERRGAEVRGAGRTPRPSPCGWQGSSWRRHPLLSHPGEQRS